MKRTRTHVFMDNKADCPSPGNHLPAVPAGQGCLGKLKALLGRLSAAEDMAAGYILMHRDSVLLTVDELASRVGVSPASIVRLGKSLGFSGYREMQMALTRELTDPLWGISAEVSAADRTETVIDKVFAACQDVLEQTRRVLGPGEVERAVSLLLGARRIEVYGVGTSAMVAMDFARKLARIGIRVHAESDPHFIAILAGQLGTGDVAIGISHSGLSREVVLGLSRAKAAGASTIGISTFGETALIKHADIRLLGAATPPLLRVAPFRTRLGLAVITDVLYTLLGLANAERTRQYVAECDSATSTLKERETGCDRP